MLLYFVVSYPFQGKRRWPLETTILSVGFYSMFIRNRMALQVFSAEYIIDCSMKNTILPNLADYRSFFHWSWVSNIVITCDKLALVNWYKTDVFYDKINCNFLLRKNGNNHDRSELHLSQGKIKRILLCPTTLRSTTGFEFMLSDMNEWIWRWKLYLD